MSEAARTIRAGLCDLASKNLEPQPIPTRADRMVIATNGKCFKLASVEALLARILTKLAPQRLGNPSECKI